MNILLKALLAALFFLPAFAGAMAAAESEDGFVVVLDPGHGGKDYGE